MPFSPALAPTTSRNPTEAAHLPWQDFEKLKQTAKHMPALTQSELSVSFHDDETIAYCAKHGIVYQAYSP